MRKILFTLVLLLAIGQGTWAQTDVSSDDELRTAIDQADYSQGQMKVRLTSSIAMGSLLDIKQGYNVQLDLNGYSLYRLNLQNADRNGQVIWVEAGGTLEIMNGASGEGHIYGGYAYDGGGIWNDGTLTISSGWIWGNKVVDENGSRGRGAGIYNSSGATLTITGGIISQNEALGNAHGGAGIFNEGTLTITGGFITRNIAADGHGGGIKNYGTLNMAGNPEVRGNTGGDL